MSAGSGPGLRDLVRGLLADPLPRGIGWPHVLGGLLLTTLAVQAVTGILLALYYSPSAAEAWESVRYIEEEVRAGRIVRGIHHFGSSAFVVLLVLHAARTFLWGAYKGRRRWTWVVGVALLLCGMGFGFTGYLLPWDLKGFFATRVGVEIARSAPLVGDGIARLLAGGAGVGELSLPRFYALHSVVLPLATVFLVALHVTLLRVHGVTPSWRHGDAPSGRTFHPHQLAKDLAVGLALVLTLLVLALLLGAPLGEKADPQSTTFVPRPEWTFLGLQQLLRIFQGRLEVVGSFLLPFLGVALLFLLPWIDRNPERDPRRRPVAMALGGSALAAVLGLTAWGAVELAAEERAMDERLAALARAEAPAPAEEAPAPDAGLLARGQLLYRELACGACHDEPTRGDNPSLAFEGSRVRRPWLRRYMEEPHRIRFAQEGVHPIARMPDFQLGEGELDALVAWMLRSTDEGRIPDRGLEGEPGPGEVERGFSLYEDLDCGSCHRIGDDGGEEVGPHLDGVARRLRPDYVHALLLDPEGLIGGTPMTDFGLTDGEARAITRFLQTQR